MTSRCIQANIESHDFNYSKITETFREILFYSHFANVSHTFTMLSLQTPKVDRQFSEFMAAFIWFISNYSLYIRQHLKWKWLFICTASENYRLARKYGDKILVFELHEVFMADDIKCRHMLNQWNHSFDLAGVILKHKRYKTTKQ